MSLVGQTIGRYRVTHQLGAGGMGIVYGARDTMLGRDVAIKVLHPEVGGRQERVRRFSQEARAASALNHPNIVTVHDAGEFEDGPFLVMELVQGESLRVLLRSGHLPVPKILDIGVQAAAALARAHESGITHRDLKPENILLRPDGYVKILDFGLAKLKEQESNATVSATITIDPSLTSQGSIMGTAAYMSPEQASGRQVDSRSDIFSLAVVLFECWQGQNPFRRENGLATLNAIVHDPVPSLEYNIGSVEWDLARILEKALRKNPDDRYQTMKDLAIDLRRLKQETETGRPASRAPAGGTRLKMPIKYGIAAAILLAVALGAVLLGRWREATEAGPVEYTQLTNFADSATSPALSPDGRMLAFIRGESTFVGPGQIYVKLLPQGEPLQLTHDNRPKMSPKFSPDGSRIAYSVTDASGWTTWVVPVLGGQPRAFLANAEGLTWIRGENNQPLILFSEMTGRGQQMGIATATESRAEQRTVYMPPEESGMAHRSYLSPDGNEVLLVLMRVGRWVSCGLTRFDGSSAVKEVGPAQAQCTDAAWSPDGKWMYFSADAGNGFHIWRQRYPDGVPEQITSGATQEEGVEVAADGRSLITSIGISQSTLWIHDARGDREVTSEGFALLPSISPDSKRLYYLKRAAGKSIVSGELWSVELESGNGERLLPDFLMRHYTISPEGERVVFVVDGEGGRSPVWVADLNRRSAPRQVYSGNARKAYFGPERDVIFLGQENNINVLYSVKEYGSSSPKLIPTPRYEGKQIYLAEYGLGISPDGKWVVESNPTQDMRNAVVVYPSDGGAPTLICRACAEGGSFERGPPPRYVNWSPDGKFLYLNFQGSIYAIPLPLGKGLPPIPVSGFRDKKELAALRGVWLIPEPNAFVGPHPSIYAYTRFAIQRNIYRVSLR